MMVAVWRYSDKIYGSDFFRLQFGLWSWARQFGYMADTRYIKERASSGKTGLKLKRGRRLGKYRLMKCLGEGGSGEVWKAKDCVEGILVALKIPHMDVNGVRDNEALFREIRLVTKLRHRHIVPVKNADIIDGYLVLATELSVGTLDDRSKPMSVRKIIYIIAQVLDGLGYAHRHRLVHCDVTPGNIFLFPNGRAALGDFGISLKLKGRMATIDDYGTPGYVAPEQAYGRPTHRSDCFSAGLILYEYITGALPRWPFKWPMRGSKRLRERTSPAFVEFMRKALSVEPGKRFANAEQMLGALMEATPRSMREGFAVKLKDSKKRDWRKVRREAFLKRYQRVLTCSARCVDCGEPIDERMQICPWCGSGRNRFESRSGFGRICRRCHKGVLAEWRYCGWCYGPGFFRVSSVRSRGVHYHGRCKYCKGGVLRFMRYCPWCRRKVRSAWKVRPFPEICNRCKSSVDSSFWDYCPWCEQRLIT